MSAQNLSKLQFPMQLPMFMDASEIASGAELYDQVPALESRDDLMARKLAESKQRGNAFDAFKDRHGAGVHKSLREGAFYEDPRTGTMGHAKGVHTPVDMSLIMSEGRHGHAVAGLGDGHHRIAAAADLGQMVPVDWQDYRPSPGNVTLGQETEYSHILPNVPGRDEALKRAQG